MSTGASSSKGAGSGSEARLQELRARIEALDRQLVSLIGKRRDLAIEVGRTKEALGLPVLDPQQEAKVVRRAAEIAREIGVDEEVTRDVIWRIIAAARDAQEGRSSWGPPRATGGPDAPPESG
jgi:chorismate mutase